MDRWRLTCLLVFVALGLHCDKDDDRYSYPRDLDWLCRSGACTVSGTARQIKGLADDSIAFEFEPGDGEVTMPAHDHINNEVLLAGEGTLVIHNGGIGGDQSVKLTNDGEWVLWDSYYTGLLRVTLYGSHPAWLLDMRTYYGGPGCL